MDEKLSTLLNERNAVMQEQEDLFAALKACSKNPRRTGVLLGKLTDADYKYICLCNDVNDVLDKSTLPFWKRPFRK